MSGCKIAWIRLDYWSRGCKQQSSFPLRSVETTLWSDASVFGFIGTVLVEWLPLLDCCWLLLLVEVVFEWCLSFNRYFFICHLLETVPAESCWPLIDCCWLLNWSGVLGNMSLGPLNSHNINCSIEAVNKQLWSSGWILFIIQSLLFYLPFIRNCASGIIVGW